MKRLGKRALAFILCLVLCIGMLQVGALAETPLSISGITASTTAAGVGETVTWTAAAYGGTGTLQYYFIVYKDGTKVKTRTYNVANTFSYTPQEAGTYKAKVYVKDADGTKVYKTSSKIKVTDGAAITISSIKANKTSAMTGEKITWTATASGGTGTLQYYFIVYRDGTKVKSRAYSTASTFSYTPKKAGTYKAKVYVKDDAETKANKTSSTVEVAAGAEITIGSIKADKTVAEAGETITWTAAASGGTGTLWYYFVVYKDGAKVKTRTYSTVNTFSYAPEDAGTYKAKVYVKDAAGKKVNKTSVTITMTAVAPITISSIKANKTSVNTGESITWTAAASGGTGTLQYYFIVYKDGTKVKTRAYSTANTFSYTPSEAGTYKATVYVKDTAETKANKSSSGVIVTAAELSAEQVYAKCSPAVFYIEVANKTGKVFASGSGFFISSDGTAVTNYHVIDGAYSAAITLPTGAEYNVLGVYDYNEDEDWAILKIGGSGFSYLELGNASTVVGGAKCYAIGSPKGLQNTISDGIISNPAQDLGGMTFIQISAAISHGSSGGALLNKYGQVIGITSGGFEEGENLGFAIPISRISGYSHNQYTELSELFPYSAPTAEYACELLKSFVKTYYNNASGNTYAYIETATTSNGYIERRIVYDSEDDLITIHRFENTGSGIFTLIISLEPDYFTQFAGYYYRKSSSTSTTFDANSYVYAPTFYGSNLRFDRINTNTGYDVTLFESFASSDLKDALGFTDYIFTRFLSDYGDLGVYLFGFTNYNLL